MDIKWQTQLEPCIVLVGMIYHKHYQANSDTVAGESLTHHAAASSTPAWCGAGIQPSRQQLHALIPNVKAAVLCAASRLVAVVYALSGQ
jgi:hypothetical protein